MNSINSINIFDLSFSIIIILSAIIALFRGAVVEILSLSTWFIAFWATHKFATYLNPYVPNIIENKLLRSGVIYLLLFILIAILITILKKLLSGLIKNIGLTGLDRLLGLLFGTIRGLLICAIIIIIIKVFDLNNTDTWPKARIHDVIQPVVNWIIDVIDHHVK